jgi:thioesterase-3
MTHAFEVFRYPVLIREHHLDTFGHVNNAVYFQLLEEARWEFIARRGYGLKDVQTYGLGPTVLEWNVKFKRELRLRESIIIESQTLSYDRKIGTLRQDILNDKEELCCQAVMTFGLFDTKERKLILPTSEWLYAIGAREAL